MGSSAPTPEQHREQQLTDQRWELLEQVNALLDIPMVALSFVWIILAILSLAVGLTPFWSAVSNVIWAMFIVDFLLEWIIAPRKLRYLRRHALVAISLAVPAFRVLRLVEFIRLARLAQVSGSLNLVTVVGTVNRGMSALRITVGQRRIGYILGLTSLVLLMGAAGMFSFEGQVALRQAGYGQAVQQGAGFRTFGDALWYSAMLLTTLGSQYWPITVAGRILTFLLALYAFSIFGYITATIATYFVGKDQQAAQRQAQQQADNAHASQTAEDARLHAELRALHDEIRALRLRFDQQSSEPPSSASSQRESAPTR